MSQAQNPCKHRAYLGKFMRKNRLPGLSQVSGQYSGGTRLSDQIQTITGSSCSWHDSGYAAIRAIYGPGAHAGNLHRSA